MYFCLAKKAAINSFLWLQSMLTNCSHKVTNKTFGNKCIFSKLIDFHLSINRETSLNHRLTM